MKPIKEDFYNAIKDSLKLSTIGECVKIHRISVVQLKMIDSSSNWEDYREYIRQANKRKYYEDRFAREVYMIPKRLDDIELMLSSISRQLQNYVKH